ncbi:MAG: site-specific integrase [Leptolyngbya sp. SIO1D8]|nr:site-specific integrase [Leptolyngbya sp. SIO1D8]
MIIQAFASHYPPGLAWVQFLFYTGARPEEVAALRWEHVASDYREVLIAEAFPIDMTEPQRTKNGKITRFPCNHRLQTLLKLQQPSRWNYADFVFPGAMGGRFDYHNFQTRHWKPTVKHLRERGFVAFYLSQYHARHTFITEALKAGMDVAEVSYLCRVSTTVIYRHYLGRNRIINVPEF